MVLVLLVAVPARLRPDAEMEVVATQRRGRRWLAHARYQECGAVLFERPLEVGDRIGPQCGLGEHDGVHSPAPFDRHLEQRAHEVAVDGRLGLKLEEAVEVSVHVPEQVGRRWPEILGFDREGPGDEHDVVVAPLCDRARPDAPPPDVYGLVAECQVPGE